MLDFSVTFIITILNIAILFFILRKILFKPVTKFIAERNQRIQSSIDQAERDKAMAQKLLEQYQTRLKNAEKEADGIIKAAQEQADAEANRIIMQGKAEAQKIADIASARLEADRIAAMALFRTEAAAIVVSAAGKLIGRELSGAEQHRFAAETLEKMAMDSGKRDV